MPDSTQSDRSARRALIMRVLAIHHEDWKLFLLRAASRRKHRNLGSLDEVICQAGWRCDYHESATGQPLRTDLDRYSHVIVLGGNMGAYEEDEAWLPPPGDAISSRVPSPAAYRCSAYASARNSSPASMALASTRTSRPRACLATVLAHRGGAQRATVVGFRR